jgi:hypothetical protein
MSLGPVRILLLLILSLAGGLAWLWVDQQGHWHNLTWAPPKALPPDIKVPVSDTPPDGMTPAQSAAIVARPLFAPDRRPPPPPAPPAAPPPPDPLANIQIQGIFSGENAGILARVDGKVRRIKVNGSVGPWTLKSIDGRDVTFTQGEENRQLRLAYARLDTVAPKPPAPTAGMPGGPTAGAGLPQNAQDDARDRLRRRNEIRAARGLPLITE